MKHMREWAQMFLDDDYDSAWDSLNDLAKAILVDTLDADETDEWTYDGWTFGDLEVGDWFVDEYGDVWMRHNYRSHGGYDAVSSTGNEIYVDRDDPVEPFEWEWVDEG